MANQTNQVLTIALLSSTPRWVAWQSEPDDENSDKPPRKMPYSTLGTQAKSNDPNTWDTREAAQFFATTLEKPCGQGGIGIVLGDLGNGVGLGGIDLDSCRNEANGAFTSWAAEVLLRFLSYSEVSPSKQGAKIFFTYDVKELADLRAAMGKTRDTDGSGRQWKQNSENNHPPGIELYLDRRYFTVTDEQITSSPAEIKQISKDTLLWLIKVAGPALTTDAAPNSSARQRIQDNSRSAIAFRLGYKVKTRGGTFDEMRRTLRTDPSTAQWFKEKGDDRQLARIWERTSQEPPAEEIVSLNEWDVGLDNNPIEPRGWLLANTFCRRFVSALIADGGVGKTALRLVQLLSLAIGRPLTGQHVFKRCHVLFISLEDDETELRRRIRAACIHHKIEPEELKGWFYACTPRGLKIAVTADYGDLRIGSLDEGLRQTINRLKIDVVSLDPFVKSHSVEENANNAIDFVTDALASIAIDCNCAVDSPHHASKGIMVAGDANKGRGASAFKDAARLVYTLTVMGEKEAETFRINDQERRQFIRLDSGKVNIARASEKADWYRLVGVQLDNGNEEYPNGDEVQTVEMWEAPDVWQGLTNMGANRILDKIERGLDDGRRYSSQGKAKLDQQAWRAVCAETDVTEGQAKQIVRDWLQNGVLKETDYTDPVERKQRKGLIIVSEKRPTERTDYPDM